MEDYGKEGGQKTLSAIYQNAGDHIETSGPLKLCRAGEIAIGFGLRHQAVAGKANGLPIDYVDPTEGNFSLIESVAVLDKGEKTNPLAMEMTECIIKNGRADLQKTSPTVRGRISRLCKSVCLPENLPGTSDDHRYRKTRNDDRPLHLE